MSSTIKRHYLQRTEFSRDGGVNDEAMTKKKDTLGKGRRRGRWERPCIGVDSL